MSEAKSGHRRLRSTYLSSIISISLVLFMLGLLGMLVLDARKISEYVKEHVQLNVFLNDEVSEQEISAFQSLLEKNPAVKSVRFISKQEALDSLKKSENLGQDATGMLDENPLPASFELKMNADYSEAPILKQISTDIQKDKMVREVFFRQGEVDTMNKNFRIIAIGILAFSLLLFFIAVALINSTIRVSMYARRFLIKSMQLVGATKGFIRKPFISRAFAHGLYAGLVACLLLGGLLYFIRMKLPEFVQLEDLKENGVLFAGIIILGILLSVISTFFAVNRYLRVRLDELYG
ncbi:MAG: permease-like cell division protein FtsX [Bacteroidota bacterium]